jgi:uncharacterized membrane protein
MAFTGLLADVAHVFEAIGAAVLVVGPTPRNVAVLGLIVLIRTFLSVSLQVEIDGHLPWRRSRPAGANPSPGASPEE